MKKLPFIFLFLTILTFSHYAQHERSECPAWSIEGVDGTVKPGELVTFTANINTFGRVYTLEYRWFAEEGLTPGKSKAVEIFSGQGTSMITVVQPEKGVTVGLEINGFPRDCLQVAYESALIASPPKPQAELIESFKGRIVAKDKTRFEKIRRVMDEDPLASYRFLVAGKDNKEIRENIDAIVKYLRSPNVVITFTHLWENSEITELWRVPPGADDPVPVKKVHDKGQNRER